LIGRNPTNLIVGWCGRFLFFVVPRQFSQVIGEWPENQILIPDWTYFHCPGATLSGAIRGGKVIGRNCLNLIVGWCGRFLFFVVPSQFSQETREWPENPILILDWTVLAPPY